MNPCSFALSRRGHRAWLAATLLLLASAAASAAIPPTAANLSLRLLRAPNAEAIAVSRTQFSLEVHNEGPGVADFSHVESSRLLLQAASAPSVPFVLRGLDDDCLVEYAIVGTYPPDVNPLTFARIRLRAHPHSLLLAEDTGFRCDLQLEVAHDATRVQSLDFQIVAYNIDPQPGNNRVQLNVGGQLPLAIPLGGLPASALAVCVILIAAAHTLRRRAAALACGG